MSPQKSHVEALVLSVILFGDGVFKKVNKVKRGHKDGGPNPIGPLYLWEEKKDGRHIYISAQRKGRMRTQ